MKPKGQVSLTIEYLKILIKNKDLSDKDRERLKKNIKRLRRLKYLDDIDGGVEMFISKMLEFEKEWFLKKREQGDYWQ